MEIVEFDSKSDIIYVVLGIDENANDRVVAICRTYETAKNVCARTMCDETELYDLWIEKHPIL